MLLAWVGEAVSGALLGADVVLLSLVGAEVELDALSDGL